MDAARCRRDPAKFRTDDDVGAHVLYMVTLHRTDVPAPRSWADLAGGDYGTVAVPDPSVAASAFGTLGWFAASPRYGVGFYAALKRNGAVHVKTPEEALGLADRVALLRDGRLVQVGTPRQVYDEPADLFAARLTGPASVIDASDGGGRMLVRPGWA